MTDYTDDSTTDLDYTKPGGPTAAEIAENRDNKAARRRRKFEELSPMEQGLLEAFFNFFKGLLGAEDAAAANGEDTEHDALFQSLNRQFADALGMDPAGDDYAGFKQRMRTPGYDPRKDDNLVGNITQSGALEEGGKINTFVKNPPRELLDLICKHESGGNYDQCSSFRKSEPPKDASKMTINEVMAYQAAEIGRGAKSTAIGKYQIISGTMKGLVKEMGLTGNEMFDQNMQDRMAMQLLKRRGLDDYLAGRITQDKLIDNMALEWASLKKSNGRGAYDGDGLNASVNTLNRERAILTALRAGGDFNNASSGTLLASADPKPDPKKPGGPALTPTGNA